MAEQAYAYVTLIPVAKGFQRRVADELSGAAPAAATAGASAGRAFSGAIRTGIAIGAAAATTAVAGLGVAVTRGFGRLQAIEEANALLRGTGNSAEAVEGIMENALASVKGTAFGLGAAARLAAGAVAAGVEPGQELERTLKAVADTAAVAGVPLADIGAIINGVVTTNKAYTGELNQLADRGIPIYQYLADQVGVTSEEISDMASNGEISSQMLVTALEDNLGGAALGMGDTVAGSFANVQASIGRAGANLIGPIFGRFSEFFNALIEGLGPIEQVAADLGDSIGEFLNPHIDTLVEHASNLSVPLMTITETMGNLATRAGSVGAFFAPIVQAFAGLAPLLPQLVPVLGMIAELFAMIATEALTILVPVLANFISTILPVLIEGFIKLAPPIIALVSELSASLIPLLANLASAIVPILVTILTILTPVLTTIVTIMSNLSPSVYIAGGAIFLLIKGLILAKAAFIAAKLAVIGFIGRMKALLLTLIQKMGALFSLITRMGLYTATLLRNIVTATAQGVAWAAQRAALIASTVATKAATVAQKALNLALRMNPIGLIITAIALLVAGLIYFFTQTEIGQRIWEAFTEIFLATVRAIGDWFAYVFTEWLPGIWTSFTDFLSNAWDTFVGYFELALEGIGNFFTGIVNGWISLFEGFVNGLINGVNFIIRALNKIQVTIPDFAIFGDLAGKRFGVNISEISRISLPRLAKGGLVDSPTMALIGEAGPEVVVPLDRFESMMGMNGKGGTVNYYAAPNKSLDAEQELVMAMRRVKVMA